MNNLEEFFYIEASNDSMAAKIYPTEAYNSEELLITEPSLYDYLKENNIVYGINTELARTIISNPPKAEFPITIAKGLPVKDGKDGFITYELNISTQMNRSSEWNFRDVMRIPSVEIGQKLATVSIPTNGIDGMNVKGKVIKARPGKPVSMFPGKNVEYREQEMAFYATSDGQLSLLGKYINVNVLYEINETLSMKHGNIDFIGNVSIRGDVPTGFTVKAGGDIKIFGMVEAATIISGGSVFVSEGLSGQGKGNIQAKENTTIGYINQGIVNCGNDLFVENSIMHSECVVRNHVFCQKGSITGGSLSAGKTVEAKDVGNRLSGKTEIVFGINKSNFEKEKQLQDLKEKLANDLNKIVLLGDKLKEADVSNNPKLRITMLRQRNTYEKTNTHLEKVEKALGELNSQIGNVKESLLTVRNNLYQNVSVSFGKYKQIVKKDYHFVQISLIGNEIVIQPLFN